ncbi:universal stress protein [Nonomuraea sp. NPDC049504]|uniref:universal stress protein n=1 Tax=Nonomuraea sp. NPDC049504 TaxID=3154729 RepID=UPI00342E85E9
MIVVGVDGSRAALEATGWAAREAALAPGDPRTALIRAAREAELLVIGSHGIGGVRGLLVGPVAFGVAGHAPCDVAVIHAPPSLPRAEIVVGVDGSPNAGRVLETAFAEAELRGAVLRAVHAWALPHAGGSS